MAWRNLINYKKRGHPLKRGHLQKNENLTAEGDAAAGNHVGGDAVRGDAPTRDAVEDNKAINCYVATTASSRRDQQNGHDH